MNNALQNIELDKNARSKAFAGQEALHSGHTQEDATMCNVEAVTEAETSPTPEVALQTTESQHPLHSPDISKAVENTMEEIAIISEMWPRLPHSVRKNILALVQSITK